MRTAQAAMGLGGTIDYFVDTVFDYPTPSEAFKIAALNAANKLRALSTESANSLTRPEAASHYYRRVAARFPPYYRP
jgi:hypothetical protein